MNKYIILLIALLFTASCGDDPIPIGPTPQPDDPTEDWSSGVKELVLNLPKFSRFEGTFDYDSVEIQMRGAETKQDYILDVEIERSEEGYRITAIDNEQLKSLHHQKYYLSHFNCPSTHLPASKLQIPIEAAINVVNSDSVAFVSSINLESESCGLGTEDDPYVISDEASLESKFLDLLDDGNTLDGLHFTQSASINLTKSRSGCAGDSETLFCGAYEGLNNAIYFLDMDVYFTGSLLYGIGENGTVSNLKFSSVSISSYQSAAALAFKLCGGTIDNVSVDGNITGAGSVGSIVSQGWGTINNCSSHAIIDGGSSSSSGYGGIIGYINNNSGDNDPDALSLTLSGCDFSGEINASDAESVGGMIGGLVYGSYTLTNCRVSGTIEGDMYVGGLIGHASGFQNLTLTDCTVGVTLLDYYYMQQYSPMDVTVKGDVAVGGLFGSLSGSSNFKAYETTGCNVSSTGCMFGYDGSNGNYDFIVEGRTEIGGFAGSLSGVFFKNSNFTNYGEIKGVVDVSSDIPQTTGGVIGVLKNGEYSGTEFTNRGTVRGVSNVGGVVGEITLVNDDSLGGDTITLKNYGYVDAVSIKPEYGSMTGGVVGKYSHTSTSDMNYNRPMITLINNANVDGYDKTGGLVGWCEGFPILSKSSGVGIAASSSVTVTGHYYVGGAFALLTTDNSTQVQHGTIYAPVTATVKGTSYVGGFYGGVEVGDPLDTYTILLDSKSKVFVSSTGSNTGGVIGSVAMEESADINIKIGDTFADSKVESSGFNIGGIIGGVDFKLYSPDASYSDGPYLEIYESNSNITVTGIAGGTSGISKSSCGGLVGSSNVKLILHRSCNLADVYCLGNDAGGLVGYLGSGGANITECYNAGTITGEDYRGGLVGRLTHNTTIKNCFNMGDVPTGSGYIGGLVGCVSSSAGGLLLDMTDCYNCGTANTGTIGGDTNLESGNLSLSFCYYLNDVCNGELPLVARYTSGESSSGLSSLRFVDDTSNYYWAYSNDGGYPYLQHVSKYIRYPGK